MNLEVVITFFNDLVSDLIYKLILYLKDHPHQFNFTIRPVSMFLYSVILYPHRKFGIVSVSPFTVEALGELLMDDFIIRAL